VKNDLSDGGNSGPAAMKLLEPIALGPRQAPNRVLFGPHETNLGRARTLSDRHVAYYARRASGGCGTIVVETASVHPSDWPYERAPLATDCRRGWAEVARVVHAGGSLALASLGHSGGQGSSAYSQAALWGPSRFPDPATREVPQQMEDEEIAALVEGFRLAAAGAAEAGLDGVEVNAGQSSLIRQFLSGITNTRSDEHGADRLKLARDVLSAVRDSLGPDLVLGLRLACDELAPWAGITPASSVDIARELTGPVDYVVATRAPVFDQGGTRPDGHTETGFALPLAEALRSALPPGVAVVAQGSVVDPDMAEDTVRRGGSDMVEMTRAQIADPDLVSKLRADQTDRVRPCVLCNQRCQVRDARNPIVSCIAEPSAGYETEEPGPAPAPAGSTRAPIDVLVVGAGPAGLETARIARVLGHSVTVVDRDDRVGGQLRIASFAPGRGRLALLVAWLERECRRLGVRFELGREITTADVEAQESTGGRVVLCTGSVPGSARFESDRTVRQLDAATFFGLVESGELGRLPDGPVVVDDPVGDWVGIGVAELLAGQGREVALVTGDLVAGTQLSRTGDLAPANARLARAGVRSVKRSTVTAVIDGEVRVEDRYTGEKGSLAASVLVESSHRLPDEGLVPGHPAPPRRHAVLRAGDAVAPRTAYEAILEARRAVGTLERDR